MTQDPKFANASMQADDGPANPSNPMNPNNPKHEEWSLTNKVTSLLDCLVADAGKMKSGELTEGEFRKQVEESLRALVGVAAVKAPTQAKETANVLPRAEEFTPAAAQQGPFDQQAYDLAVSKKAAENAETEAKEATTKATEAKAKEAATAKAAEAKPEHKPAEHKHKTEHKHDDKKKVKSKKK